MQLIFLNNATIKYNTYTRVKNLYLVMFLLQLSLTSILLLLFQLLRLIFDRTSLLEYHQVKEILEIRICITLRTVIQIFIKTFPRDFEGCTFMSLFLLVLRKLYKYLKVCFPLQFSKGKRMGTGKGNMTDDRKDKF